MSKEGGHVSYRCPKNTLGEREKPQNLKKRKRKPKKGTEDKEEEEEDDTSQQDDENIDFWDEPVHTLLDEESNKDTNKTKQPKLRKPKKSGYFSDEDASD
jgi:U11/U12 small nuclear ribonucleoprotein SNRNP31